MGPQESARSSRRRLRTLQHAWQFRYCYDSGRKLVTRYTVMFLCAPSELDGVRVGVVASRRVGNAVKRNRAKRLLREAARQTMPRLLTRSLWVVFIAKSAIVASDADAVRSDIEQALIADGLIEPAVE
jgi:ribonuclease P protein component